MASHIATVERFHSRGGLEPEVGEKTGDLVKSVEREFETSARERLQFRTGEVPMSALDIMKRVNNRVIDRHRFDLDGSGLNFSPILESHG